MKTRENELHKPIIYHDFPRKGGASQHLHLDMDIGGTVYILCPVCYKELSKSVDEIPNYCPQCGARLKEIEE